MTSFFGPEISTPYCVMSERDMHKSMNNTFHANKTKHDMKRANGEWSELDYISSMDYENKVCHTVCKYLDIDCFDKILYIRARGDEDPRTNAAEQNETSYFDKYSNSTVKDWPKIFEDNYSLVKPVDVAEVSLDPSFVETVELSEAELKPRFKFTFVREHSKEKKYDKIIIKNCLKYFDKNHKYFCRFIMEHFKEQIQKNTSLLIIQRVCDLNTLPFYTSINKEWEANDVKYTDLMQTMQNEYFTLRYDIEMFNYLIDCKSSWYTGLKKEVPYPLNQNEMLVGGQVRRTKREMVHGLRELNEGVFKYQPLDNYVELSDRMLFIGAHHTTDRKVMLAERIMTGKQKKPHSKKADIQLDTEIRKLYLEITPELRTLVSSIDKIKYEK